MRHEHIKKHHSAGPLLCLSASHCVSVCLVNCVVLCQANLAVQERKLNAANAELAKAQAQLDEKQAEFDKVKAKCDAAMKEKQVRFTFTKD